MSTIDSKSDAFASKAQLYTINDTLWVDLRSPILPCSESEHPLLKQTQYVINM